MKQAGRSWPAVLLAIAVVAGAALAGAWGLNRYLDASREARMATVASPGTAPAATSGSAVTPANPGTAVVPAANPGTGAASADAADARREEEQRLANRSFREIAKDSPDYRAMSPECKGYMDTLLAFADGKGLEGSLEDVRKRMVDAEQNYERKCVDHEAEARKQAAQKARVDAEMKPLICRELRERVDYSRMRMARADDPGWARQAAARGDQAPGPQPVFTDADRRALADAEAEIAARGC